MDTLVIAGIVASILACLWPIIAYVLEIIRQANKPPPIATGFLVVEVDRPVQYFENSIQRRDKLREFIAQDAKERVERIVLMGWQGRGDRTEFTFSLPVRSLNRYLKCKRWSGGVVAVRRCDPHDTNHLQGPKPGNYDIIINVDIFLYKPVQLFAVLFRNAFVSPAMQEAFSHIIDDIHVRLERRTESDIDKFRIMQLSNKLLKGAEKMISEAKPEVFVGEKRVPIIAFFGTKGGVGKTTIVDKFSTLVSRSGQNPNVLMVDFDVHHRGLTVLKTRNKPWSCRTVHQYIADEQIDFEGGIDVTQMDYHDKQGREFLIPSSVPTAEKVFKSLSDIDPDLLVKRIISLFNASANKHNIDLILVDCGPIVDPLTASAAHISDMAFIIGQNEPITHSSLQTYAGNIKDFFPKFDSSKVRVILNKVRGPISQRAGVFAAIPFTMEVVDFSEGLANVDEIRLIYLDYSVHGIISTIFKEDQRYKHLIPDHKAILTPNQREAIATLDELPGTIYYRKSKRLGRAAYLGAILVLGAIILRLIAELSSGTPRLESPFLKQYLPLILFALGLLFTIWGGFFLWRTILIRKLIDLKEKAGYEGILKLLPTKRGRKKFDQISKFKMAVEKER